MLGFLDNFLKSGLGNDELRLKVDSFTAKANANVLDGGFAAAKLILDANKVSILAVEKIDEACVWTAKEAAEAPKLKA